MKFTTFALIGLLCLSATIINAQNIQLDDPEAQINDALLINNQATGWPYIPPSLRRIGGNGNGDYHYWGALQFSIEAISNHAYYLGLFGSSNAQLVQRTSKFYTFSAQQVGTYNIGVIISNGNNRLNATFTTIVSNSGNWRIQSLSFTFLARSQGKVVRINASYSNGAWRHTLAEDDVNAGSQKVYNVALPRLNTSQNLNNIWQSKGYSRINLATILSDDTVLWIIKYGANWVLDEAHNNGRNMTVREPEDFSITNVYGAYQRKRLNSIDYGFDIEASVGRQQSIRLNYHIVRRTQGSDSINLNSWAIQQIRVNL